MSLAKEAKQFLRSTRRGVLSTHSVKHDGFPFGSVCPFVVDQAGAPIILISTIAEHTKNIIGNAKVSLMLLGDEADMHANARLTLMGEATIIDKNNDDLQARYLRYMPQAASYFEMHDFHFYRIQITQARYIAGFGKMGWLEGDALNTHEDLNLPLVAQETDIITHMNEDHRHSLLAYCKHFHQADGEAAEMLGIDPDGFDVKLVNQAQERILRFDFDQPIQDAHEARMALVAMSKAVSPK